MDKRLFIAAIISSLLLVSLGGGMQAVKVAEANFIPYGTVTIMSPANQTYSSNFLILNFSATFSSTSTKTITYSIDGAPQVTITGLQYKGDVLWETTNGTLFLPHLSNGSHLLEIYAKTNSTTILPDTGYASVYFTVNGTDNPDSTTPAPSSTSTPTPAPSWLTIDLAEHNYLNNVAVGQPVHFSAAVSNGLAPYRYLWKFRPFHVGTALGDFYPTGEWVEGPATQNFTFTPNSTGSHLVEVKIWDSAGAEGLFMSLPPGIWVHAVNATPTPTPSPTPTQQPKLEVSDVVKLRNFGGFYGATYDSGTNEVYIANVDFDLVSVISASTRTEIKEIPVGKQPLGVAYDSGKGEIFVANYASNSVSVISDSNHTVVATIGVGSRPTALAYDPDKGEVFVVNRDDGTVSVISDSTNKVIATIPVGKTPYGIAYSNEGKVYVTNHDDNTVSVISHDTNTVVGTVQVGVNPYHAVYDSGKGEIFVTNTNSNSVSVISESTDTVVANVTVGSMPMGLAYDSGRGLVFVGNYGDNSVSVISDETNTVIDTIAPQQQPFALAYDSNHGQIFVAHMESWSVSVISDLSDPHSTSAPTPTESPSLTPSASPPEQTAQPTQTPDRPKISDFAPVLIPIGIILIAIVIVSLLFVLSKRRGRNSVKTSLPSTI